MKRHLEGATKISFKPLKIFKNLLSHEGNQEGILLFFVAFFVRHFHDVISINNTRFIQKKILM